MFEKWKIDKELEKFKVKHGLSCSEMAAAFGMKLPTFKKAYYCQNPKPRKWKIEGRLNKEILAIFTRAKQLKKGNK